MCGFCGIVGPARSAAASDVEAMARTLAHRGPDDFGTWTARFPAAGEEYAVALGHTRLSIIDVTGSHQPLSDVSGRVHLCFNGEIFNYRELRKELQAEGYLFRTRGDTEVILALYLMRGPDRLDALEGQFAFAIFDEREGILWL